MRDLEYEISEEDKAGRGRNSVDQGQRLSKKQKQILKNLAPLMLQTSFGHKSQERDDPQIAILEENLHNRVMTAGNILPQAKRIRIVVDTSYNKQAHGNYDETSAGLKLG